MSDRICQIVSGSVEDETGAGDGAYDLHDVVGTPEEIGKAVADSLKEGDLFRGQKSSIDDSRAIFLNLRIKFQKKLDSSAGLEPAPTPETHHSKFCSDITRALEVHDALEDWVGGFPVPAIIHICPEVRVQGCLVSLSFGDILIWDSEDGYMMAQPDSSLTVAGAVECYKELIKLRAGWPTSTPPEGQTS